MTYSEWIAAARDNPQGEDGADNYGWTKTTNTGRQRTGCSVDASGNFVDGSGLKPYAISAFNIVDAVGNVYEWLDEQTYREDGAAAGWAWRDVLGAGKGKAYLYKDNVLVSLIAGGYWADGVNAGARPLVSGSPVTPRSGSGF
jgi:formylglycine-generating enzyme required for sulfatase activity